MHNALVVTGTVPVPLMISFGELRQDAEKLLACAAILPLRRRGHRSARDLALQLERRELLDAHPVERLERLDGDEAAVVHQPRHQRVHVLLDHERGASDGTACILLSLERQLTRMHNPCGPRLHRSGAAHDLIRGVSNKWVK